MNDINEVGLFNLGFELKRKVFPESIFVKQIRLTTETHGEIIFKGIRVQLIKEKIRVDLFQSTIHPSEAVFDEKDYIKINCENMDDILSAWRVLTK